MAGRLCELACAVPRIARLFRFSILRVILAVSLIYVGFQLASEPLAADLARFDMSLGIEENATYMRRAEEMKREAARCEQDSQFYGSQATEYDKKYLIAESLANASRVSAKLDNKRSMMLKRNASAMQEKARAALQKMHQEWDKAEEEKQTERSYEADRKHMQQKEDEDERVAYMLDSEIAKVLEVSSLAAAAAQTYFMNAAAEETEAKEANAAATTAQEEAVASQESAAADEAEEGEVAAQEAATEWIPFWDIVDDAISTVSEVGLQAAAVASEDKAVEEEAVATEERSAAISEKAAARSSRAKEAAKERKALAFKSKARGFKARKAVVMKAATKFGVFAKRAAAVALAAKTAAAVYESDAAAARWQASNDSAQAMQVHKRAQEAIAAMRSSLHAAHSYQAAASNFSQSSHGAWERANSSLNNSRMQAHHADLLKGKAAHARERARAAYAEFGNKSLQIKLLSLTAMFCLNLQDAFAAHATSVFWGRGADAAIGSVRASRGSRPSRVLEPLLGTPAQTIGPRRASMARFKDALAWLAGDVLLPALAWLAGDVLLPALVLPVTGTRFLRFISGLEHDRAEGGFRSLTARDAAAREAVFVGSMATLAAAALYAAMVFAWSTIQAACAQRRQRRSGAWCAFLATSTCLAVGALFFAVGTQADLAGAALYVAMVFILLTVEAECAERRHRLCGEWREFLANSTWLAVDAFFFEVAVASVVGVLSVLHKEVAAKALEVDGTTWAILAAAAWVLRLLCVACPRRDDSAGGSDAHEGPTRSRSLCGLIRALYYMAKSLYQCAKKLKALWPFQIIPLVVLYHIWEDEQYVRDYIVPQLGPSTAPTQDTLRWCCIMVVVGILIEFLFALRNLLAATRHGIVPGVLEAATEHLLFVMAPVLGLALVPWIFFL